MKHEDMSYKDKISILIDKFPLPIDKNIVIEGRPPTSANSEFLTNKEQGDWAERLVIKAINSASIGYVAVQYGKSDSISAGDSGFAEFYKTYQDELNSIGKRPDILLFREEDAPKCEQETANPDCVRRAVAAIEVRSSSFLCKKYKTAMSQRIANAERQCAKLRETVLRSPYGELLKSKNPAIFDLLNTIKPDAFRELTFRAVSWQSSEELRELSALLKELKLNIKLLHTRDYLGITPKLEDIALVNRWIDNFNVPHFYLQVFFDQAYMISFEKILSLCGDPSREGSCFSIESDVKNQGKRTIKVNIDVGAPVIGKIDMPSHFSAMKELDRGRLLFYVRFDGGQGYLDIEAFQKVVAS